MYSLCTTIEKLELRCEDLQSLVDDLRSADGGEASFSPRMMLKCEKMMRWRMSSTSSNASTVVEASNMANVSSSCCPTSLPVALDPPSPPTLRPWQVMESPFQSDDKRVS